MSTVEEQRVARWLYVGAQVVAVALNLIALATWGWVAFGVVVLATFIGSFVVIAREYLP